jgi:hypothetical protein
MVNHVVKFLYQYLLGTPWLSRIAETPAVVLIKSMGKVNVKFPAYYTQDMPCAGDYEALYLDSRNEMAIAWFEDMGTSFVKYETDKIRLRTRVRLIVWYNIKLINPSITATELALDLIGRLPFGGINNWNYMSGIFTEFWGEATTNPMQLLNKYTISEDKKMFMYPYGIFGLDFQVEYYINPNCIDPIEINPSEC